MDNREIWERERFGNTPNSTAGLDYNSMLYHETKWRLERETLDRQLAENSRRSAEINASRSAMGGADQRSSSTYAGHTRESIKPKRPPSKLRRALGAVGNVLLLILAIAALTPVFAYLWAWPRLAVHLHVEDFSFMAAPMIEHISLAAFILAGISITVWMRKKLFRFIFAVAAIAMLSSAYWSYERKDMESNWANDMTDILIYLEDLEAIVDGLALGRAH